MLFEDPPAGFDNVARALRPGGRLAFATWQHRTKNLWSTLPERVLLETLTHTPALDMEACARYLRRSARSPWPTPNGSAACSATPASNTSTSVPAVNPCGSPAMSTTPSSSSRTTPATTCGRPR